MPDALGMGLRADSEKRLPASARGQPGVFPDVVYMFPDGFPAKKSRKSDMTDAMGMSLRAEAAKRSQNSPRCEISSFGATFTFSPKAVKFIVFHVSANS